MLKQFLDNLIGIKFFDIQLRNKLYRSFLISTYAAVLTGVVASLILLYNPSIDDEISRTFVNGLINKYNSLNDEQKNQIKLIFRDMFID
jgi:hypothetical protein